MTVVIPVAMEVIKEEDLVVDAIAKNEASVFSITKEAQDETGNIIEVSAGKGFVISNEGIIVADSSLVYEGGTYFVKNSSGKFKASFISSNKNGFSLIKIGTPLDEKNKISYTVPILGDLSKMKIGQKVLILGNTISSFIFEGGKDVKINVTKSNGGAMVLNLEGEVLGVALSSDSNSFASADSILESLKSKDVKVENKTP